MIVVGIDTNSFGFHAVSTEPIHMPGAEDVGDQEDAKSTYGWSLSTGDAPGRRLLAHLIAYRFFCTLPVGTHVFIEEPLILPKNINTTRMLVMMGGILEAAFWRANPDAVLHWVDVASWRKAILGKGSGKKEVLKELAKQHTLRSLEVTSRLQIMRAVGEADAVFADYESQPDLYDAHCIRDYGVAVLG